MNDDNRPSEVRSLDVGPVETRPSDTRPSEPRPSETRPAWLSGMSEEDLGFIKRFLMASGSLKDVATEYGISYPTVRLRLDRLIEKMKLYEKHTHKDPFETLLRSAHIDGKIDLPTLTTLLTAYRKERKGEL